VLISNVKELLVRISQLAAETGVPVATIKFYLREHLLHDGRLTSPTQAQYDQTHVQRLQLVRALLGPGGLSVGATRELLRAIDDPPESGHDLLGVAQHALHRPVPDGVDVAGVAALIDRWGWQVERDDRDLQAELAHALNGLDDAGFALPEDGLDTYARLMSELAEMEVDRVPTDSREAAVRYVVLGTVLIEPVLLALRRLAQQDASARRFGPPGGAPPDDPS
jgi:DNA-binding transcriptional MerR regulator